MAIIPKSTTLVSNRPKLLHRSTRKPFSIQIDQVGGSPVDTLSEVPTEMNKMIRGVVPSLAEATTFLSMTKQQCTPFGSMRARLRDVDSAVVDYTVRTEGDAG